MAITQKFVKEHNKQCFAVYTISKETINKYFEEHEADAGQKQEVLTKFEGLRDFLRDMLEKYGQTYVEDINGCGGLTVEDDKIELMLWRCCGLKLFKGHYEVTESDLLFCDRLFIRFDDREDGCFEVYDAICLAISAYGVDFNTLIEPDDYHPFETETLSYMYEENESSEYTHKLFSFFISDDQDLEECIDDYDSRAEGILAECCEISWHYEDFGRIVNKPVKGDLSAKQPKKTVPKPSAVEPVKSAEPAVVNAEAVSGIDDDDDDDQDESEEYGGAGKITVCKYSLSKSRFEDYHSLCISDFKQDTKKQSQDKIDKGYQELEKDYRDAVVHFDELKEFLRDMINKYGQSYYGGNGSKGITITDDEISLILRTPGLSDSYLDHPRLPNNDAFDKDDAIDNLEEIFEWEARLDGSYPTDFVVALAITIGNGISNDPVNLMTLDIDTSLDSISTSLTAAELTKLKRLMSDEYLTENTRKVEFQSSNTILKYDKPQSQKVENHKQETQIKAEKKRGQKGEKAKTAETQTDKVQESKPAELAPVKSEASAPKASAAEYKPPVFPPRMSESEIENLFEFTDPFDDVNGKEFAVFADEVYYDPCIEYLKQNGAKVVLEPTEKTDYIIIEGRKQANDFEYAYKAGFKGKFTFMEEIRPHLTEEQRELYHYYEDVVGFEFDYEPKYDLETSCELMYAVYDVVLGELTKCRTRPYGESIRYVTSITHYLGFSDPAHFDYSYSEMIDWIKGKETEEDFDKYEKLIYGMSFEDKLCAVMFALARYEWTGYEDDESMCDFAYKLTQKWFRKEEKPRLKEKIAQNVEYLRLKFKDIDRSERFDGIGLKYYVPYVDLLRYEWAKDRLCVIARTDKKQKVLKSDVFSAQQGDVNLYVCYAAVPEKDEYYYLDNTQPFQWRMSAVEIWNAAKEKIVWLSKKEMPANIAELIDTSISELEELGKNGRKKMLDKIKKQAAQLEKYTHKIDPESVPCFADLGAVIKELEENKAKIQQQADAVEAELRAVDSKLREAFDQQNAQVPSAVRKKETEAEIARLADEKSRLGFFKGKQKKALRAQIDELNAQLPQLDSAITAEKQSQKAKYDPIITELGTQKSQLQQRLKELKDLIAEADSTIASLKF